LIGLYIDKGKNMQKEKRYRPNVAAVVLSSSYPQSVRIFIGQRSDMNAVWQFPQGGIDNEEGVKEALFRELKEEIGTDEIEIIAEYPVWEQYDFPESVSKGKKLYDFDGQKQKYFLVRLHDDKKVDIHTKHPEFSEYKFMGFDEIFDDISHFKKPIYKRVLKYFRREGFI
jgi:putative (di)nucleoside polyphosphate hydrolase